MSQWDAWIGREVRQDDVLTVAERWCATFDLPPPGAREIMPQGIHLCVCPPRTPSVELGDDGHPARLDDAGFLPPIPLPRRMWAGSVMTFHRPIVITDWVERVSRIASISEKRGGSGKLAFVEIDHATYAESELAVEERQTLVYREAALPEAQLSPAQSETRAFDHAGWDAHRVITPDSRLLFRYSALTFNTHRIHYDLPYARHVERYRGLVVQGPLIASLLLQLADAQFGSNRLASFAFRAVSPAIADEPLHLVMRGAGDCIEMGAFAGDGRQVTKAEGVLA